VASMIRCALLLGVTLFIVDLSQDKRWLVRLWGAIAIVGGSVALLGLLQKASGAGMIFWHPAPPGGTMTFFASSYYHGNAGAYLSLLEQPFERWGPFSEKFSSAARWVSAPVALRSRPRVGLFGFGRGTCRSVFRSFHSTSAAPAPGEWRFLHDDCLQTMLEW